MPRNLLKPSFQQGFARSKGEAEFPGLWDNLEAFWSPALGFQGSTILDMSGRGRHAVMTNMDPATDWAVGQKGLAIQYENTVGGDHLLFPAFSMGQTWTISMWYVNTTASGYKDLMNPSSQDLALHVSGANVFVYYPICVGATAINLNQLYHAVFISDLVNNRHQIYVDGKLDGQQGPVDSARTWDRIGRYNEGTNGQIGDVGMWSRILTEAEILALYQGASPLSLRRRRVLQIEDSAPASTDRRPPFLRAIAPLVIVD
jgi:hypothetical protein